jgi:hypothetical protein
MSQRTQKGGNVNGGIFRLKDAFQARINDDEEVIGGLYARAGWEVGATTPSGWLYVWPPGAETRKEQQRYRVCVRGKNPAYAGRLIDETGCEPGRSLIDVLVGAGVYKSFPKALYALAVELGLFEGDGAPPAPAKPPKPPPAPSPSQKRERLASLARRAEAVKEAGPPPKLVDGLGVTAESLTRLGAGETTRRSREDGQWFDEPVTAFPMRDGAGVIVGLQDRFRNGSPADETGNVSKGLFYDPAMPAGAVLLSVEGPTCVAAGLDMALAAVGRCSAHCPANVPQEIELAVRLRVETIIVILENDSRFNEKKKYWEWPGYTGAVRRARELAALALARGSKVRVLCAFVPEGQKDVRAWYNDRLAQSGRGLDPMSPAELGRLFAAKVTAGAFPPPETMPDLTAWPPPARPSIPYPAVLTAEAEPEPEPVAIVPATATTIATATAETEPAAPPPQHTTPGQAPAAKPPAVSPARASETNGRTRDTIFNPNASKERRENGVSSLAANPTMTAAPSGPSPTGESVQRGGACTGVPARPPGQPPPTQAQPPPGDREPWDVSPGAWWLRGCPNVFEDWWGDELAAARCQERVVCFRHRCTAYHCLHCGWPKLVEWCRGLGRKTAGCETLYWAVLPGGRKTKEYKNLIDRLRRAGAHNATHARPGDVMVMADKPLRLDGGLVEHTGSRADGLKAFCDRVLIDEPPKRLTDARGRDVDVFSGDEGEGGWGLLVVGEGADEGRVGGPREGPGRGQLFRTVPRPGTEPAVHDPDEAAFSDGRRLGVVDGQLMAVGPHVVYEAPGVDSGYTPAPDEEIVTTPGGGRVFVSHDPDPVELGPRYMRLGQSPAHESWLAEEMFPQDEYYRTDHCGRFGRGDSDDPSVIETTEWECRHRRPTRDVFRHFREIRERLRVLDAPLCVNAAEWVEDEDFADVFDGVA